MQYVKENAEAGLGLANVIAKAKDVQAILALQRSFAKKQMQAYA